MTISSVPLVKIITIIADKAVFSDGKSYKQVNGEAMSNVSGPTLANIFMCFHENRWL